MFTGIVRETGTVVQIQESPQGAHLSIRCREILPDLRPGHSVSVDGTCLTVTRIDPEKRLFEVAASPETLRLTTVGSYRAGDVVNLEPAARLSDFLGGHLVQGHVDGTGRILEIREEGNSRVFRFTAPPHLLAYCVLKGSIAVNGVSLTISALGKEWFEVTIIPHTSQVTSFGRLGVGDAVNLEVDLISKYVESHLRRLLEAGKKVLPMALMLLLQLTSLWASDFQLGPQSVLIYENKAREKASQLLVRLGRFKPDIVLEWENTADQGTLHLYRAAVEGARRFTLSQLFEVGVDMESPDTMTLWLSEEAFQSLSQRGHLKLEFNRLPSRWKSRGQASFTLEWDGQEVELPALLVEDDRRGRWTFLADPGNPLLLRYESPFYEQRLIRVFTSSSLPLRWLRKLPPIR